MTTASFTDRFNALPAIQIIRETYNFPIAATVETDIALLEVGAWYALSGQLEARWYRSIRARDERVLWMFENEEDAAQFACKFGGLLKGPVSISAWQRQARPQTKPSAGAVKPAPKRR